MHPIPIITGESQMIIQCEQCQTKFKLDDSRVADKSIKVRCAICKHVFSVAGTHGLAEDSAFFEQNAPVFQIDEDLEVAATPALETEIGIEAATPPPADYDSDFSFPPADSTVSHDQIDAQNEPDDLDFGAFDFGDESGDADKPADGAPASAFIDESVKQGRVAIPSKEGIGGLDFSGDDMFGDVVSTPPQEEVSEPISFDFGMEGFADSMGVENSADSQSSSRAIQDQTSENPFSLDDIDFGDELTSVAVQQVSTEELKPSQDLLFAPLAQAQTKPVADSGADTPGKTPAQAGQEELPPLSITSRRKESPRVSGMLVFMGILIAGLVIFYSYWGYVTLSEDKGAITTQETGRITLRSVEASFIKNKNTGDLLVISGEAVNDYNKPRAAIQIKGIVFGADGVEVSSKSAFCGNPLTEEQLTTMTMDKIETTMANQFGDSLANMEVAPGAAIPFMVVLPKPPTGATDYGVEPVGSTVATGKE
jgi:predicted Zn finger-like uncharacterized protein